MKAARGLLNVPLAIVVSTSAHSQHQHSPGKLSPPPVPVFEVHLSADPNLSVTFPQDLPVIATQCDSDGAPYVKVAGVDGWEILGFTSKGVITFATSQMTDIPQPRIENFYVGSSVYVLVTGLDNARQEEVVDTDEEGKPVKFVRTKGDPIDYIARFDRDGSYRGALKLDSDFHPLQVAAFDSGTFVAAGLDGSNKPRVALMNSSGQILKYLEMPKNLESVKSSERSFSDSGSDVIAMFTQVYSDNKLVLLVRAGTTLIYEIQESGEVKAVKAMLPSGVAVDHLVPSDRNWIIAARSRPLDAESESIYELQPQTGAVVAKYRILKTDSPSATLSCQSQNSFSGIDHEKGRLTVLKGSAEPAKDKVAGNE
ncbi:MAG TPA: hypothetical protein VJO35_18975 [Terriglobales bacterium]|nr:hypothetical protein [Terriglobales bacterium]